MGHDNNVDSHESQLITWDIKTEILLYVYRKKRKDKHLETEFENKVSGGSHLK